MKIRHYILFSFLVLLVACSSSNKGGQMSQNEPTPDRALNDWQLLAAGTQCNVEEPGQFLIKSEEEFQRRWTSAFEGIDMAPELPAVDFTEHWVLAAFLGMVRKSGQEIELASISKQGDGILVVFEHSVPGPDCITAAVIEFPYFFAAVSPFSSEKVDLKVVEKEVACE